MAPIRAAARSKGHGPVKADVARDPAGQTSIVRRRWPIADSPPAARSSTDGLLDFATTSIRVRRVLVQDPSFNSRRGCVVRRVGISRAPAGSSNEVARGVSTLAAGLSGQRSEHVSPKSRAAWAASARHFPLQVKATEAGTLELVSCGKHVQIRAAFVPFPPLPLLPRPPPPRASAEPAGKQRTAKYRCKAKRTGRFRSATLGENCT